MHKVAFVLMAMGWGGGSAWAGTPDSEDSLINRAERPFAVRFHAELGFLAPVAHTIQFGEQGTAFDAVGQLGQDSLFPFFRVSADLDVGKLRRNTIVFLYQPLDINTTGVLENDGVVDDVTFAAGTPVQFNYGFSFFRASWMYDVLKATDKEFGIGLSLQIRNARIGFRSEDGTQFRERRDVGPVPVIKIRGRGTVKGNFWMGGEVDGFYANIPGLNGGTTDVVGWIVDSSLRFGLSLPKGGDLFLNARYLGGGATGQSQNPDWFSDGLTSNELHFLSVSLGATLR